MWSHPPYGDLYFLDLECASDRLRIEHLLSDAYLENSPDELMAIEPAADGGSLDLSLLESPHSDVLVERLNQMLQQLPARSVIVEFNYVDRDLNIAYAHLYSRAFRDYPRRTIRLHFFSSYLQSSEALDNHHMLQTAYIGFCVLSPFRPRTIWRTVLPCPTTIHSSVVSCITSETSYSVNLAGIRLEATGAPFIQQDGRIAACASAAVWMSTSVVGKRWGSYSVNRSVAEITNLATIQSIPRSGRGVAPGLDTDQVMLALQRMGYEPVLHVPTKDVDATRELIYKYVESSIPAILILRLPNQHGHHAVTVVGHTYDVSHAASEMNESEDDEKKQILLSTVEWCPQFIIHDDQIGPYVSISIAKSSTASGKPTIVHEIDSELTDLSQKQIGEWYEKAVLEFVIAPLPPRHVLLPEEASAKGISVLSSALSLHATRFGIDTSEQMFFRTLLVPSNDYKSRFAMNAESDVDDIDVDIAAWYRGSSFSRYIWVVELCRASDRNGCAIDDIRIIGDVTIDPTSSPWTLDFITMRLARLFFRMAPREIDVAEAIKLPKVVFESDQPYKPWRWSGTGGGYHSRG